MAYWLIKSEPDVYSWQDFLKEKRCSWEGVRNYAARNNLRDMKKGDLALFYHSNQGMAIVGIAEVVKEHYADPSSPDPSWLTVDLVPHKSFKQPVTLQSLKQDPFFRDMDLLRLSRLSVGKVRPEEFRKICVLAGLKA